MITPKAASFVNARIDHHNLKKIALSATIWSTKTLIGYKDEYVAYNHPTNPQNGVKEVVIHFHTETEHTLTAELAPEVLQAARPRRDEPCHYVISADAYSDDFAETFDNLTREEDAVTLIDRSIMEAWNEDRFVLHRLAMAQHTLADDRPSHLFLYEIGDPDDVVEVSGQFANLIYKVCALAVDYNNDLDLAEGVEEAWGAVVSDYHPEGQVKMALAALDIAVGAIEGLFGDLGVDPEISQRALTALAAAADAIDPEHNE